MKRFLILAAAYFLLAAPTAYAQNTLVTNTFKTPEGKTPLQANLKSSATIGATPIYGKAYFRATDVAGSVVREFELGGITYAGEVLGFIKSDGTLISYAETAGVVLIPLTSALPSGLAYCLELQWNGSTDGRVAPTTLKGKNLCKNVPDTPTAVWANLATASLTSPTYGYQTGLAGAVLNYENWTCVASVSVPTPAAGFDNFFCDSADTNKLKRKISDGTIVNVEAGGDITDVGNCATGACFQAATANTLFAGPASGVPGIAALRALVDTDVPDTITASNYLPLAGGTLTGTLVPRAGALGAGTAPFKFQAGALNTTAEAHAFEWDGTDLYATNAAAARKRLIYSDGSITGNAATATALAADPANCAAGQAAAGVTAAGVAEGCAAYVTSVSGTAEEISSTGGATPTLSLPAVLNLSAKTLKGGSPLVFEGLTADAFKTTVVVTDPTAARNFTLPNADAVAIQPLTCGGTDKVSAISALGVVTCTADQGGAGSGDNITVNAVAAVDANFKDGTSSGNDIAVKFSLDSVPTPDDLTAKIVTTDIRTATFGGNADFVWTFDTLGASSTLFNFNGTVLSTGGFTRWDVPNELRNVNAGTLTVSGRAPDGATAIGVISNNTASLITAGAKIHSFQNNSVEKSYIDKDGGFSGNAATATALAADPTDCGANVLAYQIAASGALTCRAIVDADVSGGDLGALAALASTGILARTAADTYALRTLTGTTGNVTVTNGDGVAGNPTLDLGTTAVQTDQANTWSAGAQDMGAATSFIVPKAAGAAPTADGDFRYDTTRESLVAGGNGAVKGFVPRILYATNCTTEANCAAGNEVDADTLQQGVTETNFASNWTMPASFLLTNKIIEVCADIELTTSASAPTGTLRFKLDTTVIAATGGIAVGNSQTARTYTICARVQGVAALTGTDSVQVGGWQPLGMGNVATTPNVTDQPATVGNLTLARVVQTSWQWGAATTGNTAQLNQFFVKELY